MHPALFSYAAEKSLQELKHKSTKEHLLHRVSAASRSSTEKRIRLGPMWPRPGRTASGNTPQIQT